MRNVDEGADAIGHAKFDALPERVQEALGELADAAKEGLLALSACDVQVFAPSPTEGTPHSVILGQLCRRPVIATRPAGADEMLPPRIGASSPPITTRPSPSYSPHTVRRGT